ncbi:phosducin [Cucurbitaria berberidis CBS 394.84]|uniref:Phosducin n=1 Tax=Cucurbitaria berberidis CBS 394.84 TaxID=1168544 RepID=A0A9P4GKW4_9PLEO|nr:phosducin [Cucurbitaria berberidis CBS 394.84]KAF1847216.1 phosducin [Cucurbitaria berberidis CBS 394.84]
MTTTSAAQDEFNELMRDKGRESRHPEDRLDDSDLSDPDSIGAEDDYLEKIDTDDELDIPHDMRANYYMPSLRSEANTGPKGVIADARAFEQAKKQARRFTWKKSPEPTQYTVRAYHDDKALSDEENEESFMTEWRKNRLRELETAGNRIRSRTNSPSRRIYGSMPMVDAEEYLDVIDHPAPATMVVVFIYQPNTKDIFTMKCEACMHEVARRNDTVRFVKLHNDIAEIHPVGMPAVVAYKGGKMFAELVALDKKLPKDSQLTAVSLETLFRQ